MTDVSPQQISLVLSGGGVRAMVFHLGALRYLAQHGALEQVERISSVSGGSLLVGLIFQRSGMQWPGSSEFLSSTYPKLREQLCSSSLQWAAARQLLNPLNWRFALSRANLVAQALRSEWGVRARLSDLPAKPAWSINGTTAETGKRFRFKADSIGDYVLGHAQPGAFPLASALAVSAAFPGGFGPLTLDANRFAWQRRPNWGDPVSALQPVEPMFRRVHLYDGGVYDNLGLEPYFDAGLGTPKDAGQFILVSDASAPLISGFSYFALNPWRLKRVSDIMSDQSRALRVRTFVQYLRRHPDAGAYFYIGSTTRAGMTSTDRAHPAMFATTLRRLLTREFDALSDHGHHVAQAGHAEYGLHAIGPNNATTRHAS
jgi:NTE family protein